MSEAVITEAKALRVVCRCETIPQLKVAIKYLELADKAIFKSSRDDRVKDILSKHLWSMHRITLNSMTQKSSTILDVLLGAGVSFKEKMKILSPHGNLDVTGDKKFFSSLLYHARLLDEKNKG